jgi:integrase
LERYSPATAGKAIKRVRQLFRCALKRKLIGANPFSDTKAPGQSNEARKYFVTLEDTGKLLDAAPDVEWKAIIGLARFGGVRTPSETLSLRWVDINWEKNRFWLTSPKTEHLAGREGRWVPLFPELRVLLEEAFEQAQEGAVYVIQRYRDPARVNIRTQFKRIIKKAGLKGWPRLFQNMRSSRQTELAGIFPLFVVCRWLGNSEKIADKHYLTLEDSYFEKAAKGGAKSGALPAQNAAQQLSAPSGTDSQDSPEGHEPCDDMRLAAIGSEAMQNVLVTPTGFEPVSRP